MRTLLLLRHAKAAADNGSGDHERRLDARGRSEAAEAGRRMQREGLHPAFALVSDARRTRETAEIVAACFEQAPELRFKATLYGAAPAAILAEIRAVAPEIGTLLVIGHNPGIGELARSLAGTGPAADVAGLQARFPTAAAAVIAFDLQDWNGIGEKQGRLERFLVQQGR